MLFNAKDKAGEFLRETLAPTLVYTARVTPEIAHSIDDVDRVMRWGFGWELGPFELFDAIGVREVLGRGRGGRRPRHGGAACRRSCSQVLDGGPQPLPRRAWSRPPRRICRSCARAKEQSRVIKKNAGASLVDLGDGVLCVEFHSKMNAIGGDTVAMLQRRRQGGREERPRRWSSATTRRTSPPAPT